MASTAIPLLQAMASASAQAWIAGLWQGCLLLLAVTLILRLLPGVSAAMRSLVWSAAFALVVLLPLAELHPRQTTSATQAHVAIHADARWAIAMASLWAAMTMFRLAELASEGMKLWGTWRRAVPLTELLEDFAGLLPQGGRQVTLCRSAEVEAPCVIGFFRPRLLLPESLLGEMTTEELRQIALHEWEHLRRGDDWVNLAQRVAMALFPLNPALPWMSRRMSLERELACDEGVIRTTAAPIEYARCLTQLAERRLQARRAIAALALSAWNARPELVERVHRLLRPAQSMSRTRSRVTASLLGAAMMAGGAAMAGAPPLISFASGTTSAATGEIAHQTMPQERTADRAETVSYRPASTARAARMIPAVARMETALADRDARAEQPTPRLQRHPRRARTSLLPRSSGQTEAQAPRATPRGAARVYVLRTQYFSSYAAVPFEDGWLILQL